MTSTIAFYAQLTTNKAGSNGLAVTWDIDQITRADGTRVALVTGGATSIVIGRRGLYGYLLAGADLAQYDYIATAITADAGVDQKEVAGQWSLWSLPSVPQSGDVYAKIGAPVALDGGVATLAGMLLKMADDADGGAFDATTDSQRGIGASATAPSATQIDAQLSATHGAGAWGGASGVGAVTVVIPTTTAGGVPIAGVDVLVYTELACTNLVASGVSDAFGDVTVYLDPGTYYVRRQLAGWKFDNPEVKAAA